MEQKSQFIKERRMKFHAMVTGLLIAICLTFMMAGPIFALGSQDAITVQIPTQNYEITSGDRGHEISLENFGRLLIPGKPALPSRIFAIAIPPGAEVTGISYDLGEEIKLPGNYNILPAPLPRVIGQEDPAIYNGELLIYEENYNSAYGSNDAYPENIVEMIRSAGYRKYNLADVRVTPFRYHPVSGDLYYYPEISVDVEYEPSQRLSEIIIDNLEKTERIAEEIIINYNEAQSWHPRSMLADEEFNDFVIITISSLTSAVTPLVDWEIQKGRSVEVVTTTWIDANYIGYDLAAKIRNFLRDKYPSSAWGIEDVLIVGHYDDVPMRRTEQDLGYGKPETDYYYAELSLPDDQSWDIDIDHLYGEETDYNDFYAEVNVGRIPWSDSATVSSICQKSAAYEQNNDPAFKKNILLLGAFFWDDDPNPRTDCAVLMEAMAAHPSMSDWTMTRMYEQGHSTYPMDYDLRNSNVMSVWPSGSFAFVNYAGHGSPTSSHIYHNTVEAFISSGNCPQLNDSYPAIMFADACSNSDTDYLNIGQAMMWRGGVGFLGATKVARGCPAWDDSLDGSTQSLDYYFTTSLTSGEYTLGQAHQRALRLMYTYGLWTNIKYETFEWGAIWGNPDIGMSPATFRPLVIIIPDGTPENVHQGIPTTFIVRIENGGENYIEGSGTLNFRFDNGIFQASDLIYIGENLFEATLPAADCNTVPQFYISAYGDQGSLVSNPPDAPESYYTSSVGVIVENWADNFETDLGWTVSGDALGGNWERGVPLGTGDRGDPTSDYDGSGQCFLTGNSPGDSDVDSGYTYLTSPTLNLVDVEQPTINYALWYTNNIGYNPNDDIFNTYISSDNGANWTLAETIGPASAIGWNEHSINVTDFISITDQVKIRFEASDLNGGSVVEAGIDAFGVFELQCDPTSIADNIDDPKIPREFRLFESYPNPFNNQTVIRYGIPVSTEVSIIIYDLLGRQVATLLNGKEQAGYHHVIWNAKNHSSGVYFYKIQAGDFTETKQMTLLR